MTRLDILRTEIRTDRLMLAAVEAAIESLKGGTHGGPCTNEGDEFDLCLMHVRWLEVRHANLLASLRPFTEEVP